PGCYTEAQCTALTVALASEPTVTNEKCEYDAVIGCSCTLTSTQPSMSSGTYQVQGTNVTLTPSDPNNKPSVSSFCVSGNTASLFQLNANGASSTLILTK
ncbi:MAG TPA: hypothetical protein VGC79_21730, partial [Polyangiaceae bacterium]